MAQRLHTGAKKISNANTVNCESYVAKLIKKGLETPLYPPPKEDSYCGQPCTRHSRKRLTSRNPSAPVTRHDAKKDVCPARDRSKDFTVQNHGQPTKIDNRSAPNRCKPRFRSVSPFSDRREPWDKLLSQTQRKPKRIDSFSTFDPLRTVHFLGSELKNIVKAKLPHDSQVEQIVTNMQAALLRIPKDLECTKVTSSARKSRVHRGTVDSSSQTPSDLIPNIELLEKQLEASGVQLETNFKKMELYCKQLSEEKEQLVMLHGAEKETVKFLRNQIEAMDATGKQQLIKIAQYKTEIQAQQATINMLNAKAEYKQNGSSKPTETEFKVLIQQMRKKNIENREKITYLTDELTRTKIERDKFEAIVQVRQQQIDEMKTEMDTLKEVLKRDLIEIQEEGDHVLKLDAALKTHRLAASSAAKNDKICDADATSPPNLNDDGDKNMTISSINTAMSDVPERYVKKCNGNVSSINSGATSELLRELKENGFRLDDSDTTSNIDDLSIRDFNGPQQRVEDLKMHRRKTDSQSGIRKQMSELENVAMLATNDQISLKNL